MFNHIHNLSNNVLIYIVNIDFMIHNHGNKIFN